MPPRSILGVVRGERKTNAIAIEAYDSDGARSSRRSMRSNCDINRTLFAPLNSAPACVCMRFVPLEDFGLRKRNQ
jgi:hypothetical protein